MPKPVALTFDFLSNVTQRPLSNLESLTSENDTIESSLKIQENYCSSQSTNQSSNNEYQLKSIKINENTSFYLIRYDDNKPYISCFNLASLLNQSESEISSETV